MSLRGRHFSITWNEDGTSLAKWNKRATKLHEKCKGESNLRNYSGQVEKGESGNLHIQLYLGFIKRTTKGKVDALLGTDACHVELAEKPKAVWNYCKKEDTRVGYSFHSDWQDTNQGKRNDIQDALEALHLANGDTSKLGRDHEECYVKYHGGFDKIGGHIRDRISGERSLGENGRNVTILWGEPGVGKTHHAINKLGATFVEYDGKYFEFDPTSDTLLIDEADKYPWRELPASQWLRLLDNYSFKLRVMYGHAIWNPKNIILTMNEDPEEWFFSRNEGLRRRVRSVLRMDGSDL